MPKQVLKEIHVKRVAEIRSAGSVSKDGKSLRVIFFLQKEDGTSEQMVMLSDHAEQFALDVLKEVAKTRAVSELIGKK